MPEVTWTHPELPTILDMIPLGTRSLVDVGCGRGIIGELTRIYREPTRLVGVDVYVPYLEFCARFRLYDECVHRNLENLPLPFDDREFDVAACIDVIEHLPRESGLQLLGELERIAGRVIVTTPSIFFHQWEYDGNPHQRHVSVWAVWDFRRRGYKVYGVGGLKVLGRRIRFVSTALGRLTRFVPGLSSHLLCVKDVGGPPQAVDAGSHGVGPPGRTKC